MNDNCFLLHLHEAPMRVGTSPRPFLVLLCHIQNKNAKTGHQALKLGLHLDTVHAILFTKFQGNPL